MNSNFGGRERVISKALRSATDTKSGKPKKGGTRRDGSASLPSFEQSRSCLRNNMFSTSKMITVTKLYFCGLVVIYMRRRNLWTMKLRAVLVAVTAENLGVRDAHSWRSLSQMVCRTLWHCSVQKSTDRWFWYHTCFVPADTGRWTILQSSKFPPRSDLGGDFLC